MISSNLVPRAFHPFFKGKALGTRLDLKLLRYMLISPKSGNFFFPVTVLHPIVHPNLRSVIKTQRTPKRVVVYLFTPSIPKSIRPSPFLFRLESNAFPDGSVGRIDKKKTFKKKKTTRSLGIGGLGTPG